MELPGRIQQVTVGGPDFRLVNNPCASLAIPRANPSFHGAFFGKSKHWMILDFQVARAIQTAALCRPPLHLQFRLCPQLSLANEDRL